MATLTLARAHSHNRASVKDGFEPPEYVLRKMPSFSDLPKDEIGREIALLLAENPQIASHFGDVNPDALPREAKAGLLANIKEKLGIRPIRRRRLGYVGPDAPVTHPKQHSRR